MIAVKELKRWLNTLPEGDAVGIDEGGLQLVSLLQPDVYNEVGGYVSKEEAEDEDAAFDKAQAEKKAKKG
jgi:hypothetical protein